MKILTKLNKQILQILTKLEFAIFLFFLIVLYGLIGSILEQDQSKEYYIEKYGTKIIFSNFNFADLVINFHLGHIFSTPTFYFLLILLSLSLITCSFTTQLPIFLFSRGSKFFNINKFSNINCSDELFLTENTIFISLLSFRNYLTVQKKGSFYSYKGLVGRFSPLIIHLGLIISIFGASFSVLGRFSAQEFISKSEIFSIQNITQKGKFTFFPKYSVRLNDFWIVYDINDSIKQYYSNISILNFKGDEIKNKTVFVNHPLVYQGLKIYQTDWDLFGLRIARIDKKSGNKIQQLPLSLLKNSSKSWISEIEIEDSKDLLYLIFNKVNNSILIYDKSGKFLKQTDSFEKIVSLEILETIPRSGLQLKMDPGIIVLYFGFFLILISIILTNQSFSEFWLLKNNDKLLVIGKTNRSQLNFNLEFFKILKTIRIQSLKF